MTSNAVWFPNDRRRRSTAWSSGKNGPRFEVDGVATDARRMQLRAKRGALPMFDRGPYVEAAREAGGLDWPEGWQDPDAGWWAETAAEAAE